MEGAALHYTCLMEKIPFIQLRSISNYIAERDKTKWDMKRSIINLNNDPGTFGRNDKLKTINLKLSLGFSPCPNDTFIFDALVNKKIDTAGFEFEVMLEDVETLNQWALESRLDITKLSFPAFFQSSDEYVLLNSGSALGKGVGPLLISRSGITR